MTGTKPVPTLAVLGLSLWGFFCLFHVLQPYFPWLPPPQTFSASMLHHAGGLLFELLMFWTAAWGLGTACLALLRTRDASTAERFALAAGLGAGVLGLGALGLGLAGLSSARHLERILRVLFWGSAAAAAARALSALKARRAARSFSMAALPAAAILPLIFLVGYGLYSGLTALAPPISYDGLVYHAALPDLFLRNGRIFPTPFHVYSGIPFGVEMLNMWALALDGNGYLCQLLHWSLGLLAAATIILTGRRLGSVAAGAWAAAIFYSNPMVLIISGVSKVELGAAFYTALTVFALVVWSRGKEAGWLALAGLFTGLALGTKYQMILLLPAAAGFLMHVQGARAGLRSWARVGGIAAAVAAPWVIKNAFFYGNPIYPFLDAHVSSASVVIPGALAGSARARDLGSLVGTWDGFVNFATHLWRYSFVQTNDPESLLSVIYLMALPFFLLARVPRAAKTLLIFGGLVWLPLNLVTALTRFSIPALVPLSLAVGLALEALPGAVGPAAQAFVAAGLAVGGFCGFNVLGMQDIWPAMESPSQAVEYLANEQPGYPFPPFAAYQWANSRLPEDAKVLLIGEQRGFYLRRNRFPASLFAREPLAQFVRSAASSDDLYRRLKAEGVTHLFVNEGEFLRTVKSLDLDAAGRALLKRFWREHLELVFPDYPREPARVFDYAFLRLADRPEPQAVTDLPPFLAGTEPAR